MGRDNLESLEGLSGAPKKKKKKKNIRKVNEYLFLKPFTPIICNLFYNYFEEKHLLLLLKKD